MIELATPVLQLEGPAIRQVRVIPYLNGQEQIMGAMAMLADPATGRALTWFHARPGNPAQGLAVSALPAAVVVLCTATGYAAAASAALGSDIELHIELTTSATVPQLLSASVPVEVTVDDTSTARTLLAIELPGNGPPRIAAQEVLASGSLGLTLQEQDSRVYLLALDDWGQAFQPGAAVQVGDLIRPGLFAGVLYRITSAGNLPATEPDWWPVDEQAIPSPLGSAQALAVRYYRPLAHGPVPVTIESS